MLDPTNIRFVLNGAETELTVDAAELLVDILRGPCKLKGTKRSCDVEVCGACTVLVDGLPVSSCTTLAVDVEGKKVTTIEGLSENGKLSKVQQAFVDHAAMQCGFCTSGMVLATTALLEQKPHASEAEIRHFLRGNICRCTGYVKILEAVKSLV
ncbi:MAG: (2Fe-2S)-binding protein [Xanthobacteraceae bacterium]|nr:(2Fe-2S)-binding protein [Xanthobacteraceae bacterium]MBX3521795.1 (2Fe-2S)-binding protein [Xanthobacteraceae bacterium]MBX3535891.1 (2Fe-2S)-binding protein [Xanthobacteraceae bacterium]MBX3550425.1 (2Fe-2S)-binding protein [Xanthobacteraceae bacterium]MCW5674594.1 (2Fe-2S)-binding protein [Xanthobacteraceae bacterium]